jgi:hypothetical protein
MNELARAIHQAVTQGEDSVSLSALSAEERQAFDAAFENRGWETADDDPEAADWF